MARSKPPAERRKRPPPSNSVPVPTGAGDSPRVVMGRILGPFGVQGWLKVKTFTETPEALGEYASWQVGSGDEWRQLAVEGFEVHAKGPVAKLAGCDDREAALKLQGREVAVPRSALGDSEEGSIYWVDLVGLEVVDEAGALLGTVAGLFEAGETSVMVVRGQPPRGQDRTSERERMIPFVPEYVKSVDRDGGRITVEWKADYDA